jgi:hypothetical protein
MSEAVDDLHGKGLFGKGYLPVMMQLLLVSEKNLVRI